MPLIKTQDGTHSTRSITYMQENTINTQLNTILSSYDKIWSIIRYYELKTTAMNEIDVIDENTVDL